MQRQLAEELDRQVSAILCWPRALPNGSELARLEQQTVEGLLDDADVEVIVLLGEGGSGKSALMATLGNRLKRRDGESLECASNRLPKYVENPKLFESTSAYLFRSRTQ